MVIYLHRLAGDIHTGILRLSQHIRLGFLGEIAEEQHTGVFAAAEFGKQHHCCLVGGVGGPCIVPMIIDHTDGHTAVGVHRAADHLGVGCGIQLCLECAGRAFQEIIIYLIDCKTSAVQDAFQRAVVVLILMGDIPRIHRGYAIAVFQNPHEILRVILCAAVDHNGLAVFGTDDI